MAPNWSQRGRCSSCGDVTLTPHVLALRPLGVASPQCGTCDHLGTWKALKKKQLSKYLSLMVVGLWSSKHEAKVFWL